MDKIGGGTWAEIPPSDRFIFILGMIRDKHPSISNQSKRNLCHLGQHPQCLRWLLREKIEAPPVGSNNLANWAKNLEDKGLFTRDKNEDTLICGEKQVLGETNSKIPFLTEMGDEHYSNLVKQHTLNLELLPDWFLFMCLDENIPSPRISSNHYPLPVSIRDFRPINKETIEIDEISHAEPVRSKFLLNNISNFSYTDLSRLLREECGIHLLTGSAGSGKTQILQAAAKVWFMPHVEYNKSDIVHATLSCRKYAEYLIERETPPEDEEEFELWCSQDNHHFPPEPDTADDKEWEDYEREKTRINIELTVKNLENYIFENYIQHLPNTTSKETPLRMLKDARPKLAIFVDGLDEISNEYRNRILTQLNLLVENNPLHRVLIASRPIQTPEQFQPELQTLIELVELPEDWPSKDFGLQSAWWPKGLERTPLTWMLVRATKDKTSEEASEAEILDQYLDDCMEKALTRKKPPLSKKNMWSILRKTALLHIEIGMREFCEIPGGVDNEGEVNDWEKTMLWAYLNMQIIQETHGWRISGFEHMNVAEETYQFSHRRIQEYLASQSFDTLDAFFEWFNHQNLQNPNWCWPVVRDVLFRFNASKEIIQYIEDLDEDIIGHREGLINYLNGENTQLLPRGIPEHHRKVEMKIPMGDTSNYSAHEYPQSDCEESIKKVELIITTLRRIEELGLSDSELGISWENTFGLEPTFLQCLTYQLLEIENRKTIQNIIDTQPERALRFWEYFIKLLWISKKPVAKELEGFAKRIEKNFLKYNWDVQEWIKPWREVRTFTLLDLDTKNEVMLEVYRMNKENPIPFGGPEQQLVHFLDGLGFSFYSVEISWMFGLIPSTFTFNRWLRVFNLDSHQKVNYDNDYSLQALGWILSLCRAVRFRAIIFDGPNQRIRHPRFKHQKLSSTIPNVPNTPNELLDMMDNPAPMIGNITINSCAFRFELKEMLVAAEETDQMGLLKHWLFKKPALYFEPEKIGGDPKGVLSNHYRNQFLEHWCLSPYMQGDVPSLKDYPWFEELWD